MADITKKIGDLDAFPLSLGGNVFDWTADREAGAARPGGVSDVVAVVRNLV